MFKYGGIQNIIPTPDKELNILIYRSPSYVIIWKSYTLLKMVRLFGPPYIWQRKQLTTGDEIVVFNLTIFI